jgi:hypothetical protein
VVVVPPGVVKPTVKIASVVLPPVSDIVTMFLSPILPSTAIGNTTGKILDKIAARYARSADIGSARLADIRSARSSDVGPARSADVGCSWSANIRSTRLADVSGPIAGPSGAANVRPITALSNSCAGARGQS